MCKGNTERKESSNKETLLDYGANSWGKDSNRVETEREIPKLKLFIGKYKKRIRAPYEFLQEFQYGT